MYFAHHLIERINALFQTAGIHTKRTEVLFDAGREGALTLKVRVVMETGLLEWQHMVTRADLQHARASVDDRVIRAAEAKFTKAIEEKVGKLYGNTKQGVTKQHPAATQSDATLSGNS